MNIINLVKEEYNNIIKEVGEASAKSYKFNSKKINKNTTEYKFTTELKTNYTVVIDYYITKRFDENSDNGLLIDFYTGEDESVYTIENKGELYKVMATITNIIKDYIKNENRPVNFISFISTSKRSKLYDKYLTRFNLERRFDKFTGRIYYFFKNNLNENFQDDDINITDDQVKSDIQHYIDLLDNLDKNNPRREYYINKLKDIYNYEYKDPYINYNSEDIIKQITNRRYNTKTNKGFEFTFITKKNKTHNNIVQIEMFDNHYNNIGHVGFTIDTEDKSIVIGGAKVFDKYKRKGIYSAVVDFIQQVADKFNLKIKEGSRSKDAREFWQDRTLNNKKEIKYKI